MTVVQAASDADIPVVQSLFGEYATWVGVDLSFQDFDRELAELPGVYVPPSGVLFVARVDDKLAGCVAAHRWRASVCEMKRLFVRDGFRGWVAAVLWWRASSHGLARRGTSGSSWTRCRPLHQAQRLYARLGFQEVAPYRLNPVPGVRFLELALG